MPAEVCGVGNARNGKLGFVEKFRLRCGGWHFGSRRIGNWLTLSLSQERSEKRDQRQDGDCDASCGMSGLICGHAKTPSTSAKSNRKTRSAVYLKRNSSRQSHGPQSDVKSGTRVKKNRSDFSGTRPKHYNAESLQAGSVENQGCLPAKSCEARPNAPQGLSNEAAKLRCCAVRLFVVDHGKPATGTTDQSHHRSRRSRSGHNRHAVHPDFSAIGQV